MTDGVNINLFNLPPPQDSREFNERLRREFGELNGYPRYRVVWGMDERHKIWQAGKPRIRYVMTIKHEQRLLGYTILNATRGVSRVLKVEDFKKYKPKPGEVIVPRVEQRSVEIGFPFWYLEYYASPTMFGSTEDWDKHRWIRDDSGHLIDLLGSYPAQGRYELLTELSAPDENGQYTEMRPLNDATFEFIRSLIKGEHPTIEEARRIAAAELPNLADEVFEDFRRDAEEVFKHKHSIVIG
jgi:hypothetical protein